MNIIVDEGFNNDYLNFLKLIKPYEKVNIYSIKDYLESNSISNAEIDLVLFTGGEDVNPMLYGENKGPHTYINNTRDEKEKDLFNRLGRYTPKLGICRGSQLLTVLNKGKLIQDVTDHTRDHECEGHYHGDIIEFEITSTHHQMMFPYNLPSKRYEVLAWSKYHRSSHYLNGNNDNIELPNNFLEPEIVFYPATKSLAIQGHPEFDNISNRTRNIIINYIKNYLFNN